LIPLIVYYVFQGIDTILRPLTDKENKYKSKLLLLAHILNPVFIIFGYYENLFLISKFLTPLLDSSLFLIGLSILLVGGVIQVYSRYRLGRYGFGKIIVEENQELITTGIYKYIRHPMYFSGILVMLGIMLSFRYLIFGIIYLIIYLFMIIKRINTEELILEEEFEEKYAEYKKNSKKLIPFRY
jgi:protein-S-isoprenylcysteine O-methyltransferase Ste14